MLAAAAASGWAQPGPPLPGTPVPRPAPRDSVAAPDSGAVAPVREGVVRGDSASGGVGPGGGSRRPGAAPAEEAEPEFDLRRYRLAPVDSSRLKFHRGRFDAPRWVMLRSLLVPGWGQLHNGSWLKALVLGGGEIALIAGIADDSRRLDDLKARADWARVEADEATYATAVNAYNDRLNRLVSREWLLGGVMVYALMDAYVDAQFRDFKIEFEYDPALPAGRTGAGGARVALEWAF